MKDYTRGQDASPEQEAPGGTKRRQNGGQEVREDQ